MQTVSGFDFVCVLEQEYLQLLGIESIFWVDFQQVAYHSSENFRVVEIMVEAIDPRRKVFEVKLFLPQLIQILVSMLSAGG